MKIYLVGGAVRDEILGLESNDRDYVVVGATVQDMIDLDYEQVGKEFPVFLHPETKEEYALARKERKTGVGHTAFEFVFDTGVTLEEDLFRRDLTINAIAKDLNTGNLFDPYGGLNDINNKILRHVSSHFSEDPLRVLRITRFMSQLSDFKIADDTKLICKEIVMSGELRCLTPERIWKETVKALESSNPTLFFESLLELGALEEFFPELSCLLGIPQSEIYHPEGCVWTHTMLVLKAACKISDRADVRFAALTHDLGKGVTPKDILPAHHNHEEAGVPVVRGVCNRFRVPNKFKKLAIKVCERHLRVHRCMEMKPGKVLTLLKNIEALRNDDIFNGVLECCRADDLGKLRDESKYEPAIYLSFIRDELKKLDLTYVHKKYEGVKIGEQITQIQIKEVKKASNKFKTESKI